MTKPEKRHFKIFSKLNSSGKENNYTLLFDEIDRMENYDHQKLVKTVQSKIKTKNISTLKTQLSDLILSSLRHYTSDKWISVEINRNIDFIRILYIKGLYDQAISLVKKTKDIAVKYNDYIVLERLAIVELAIADRSFNLSHIDVFLNKTYPLVKEGNKVKDLRAEYEYQELLARSLCLKYGSRLNVNSLELNRLKEIELLNSPILSIPKATLFHYYAILGYIANLEGRSLQTYRYRKEALNAIEQYDLKYYQWFLHAKQLLYGLAFFGMSEEYELELKRFKSYINTWPSKYKNNYFNLEYELFLWSLKLQVDIMNDNIQGVLEYIHKIKKLIENQSFFINDDLRFNILSNFVSVYLRNKEYKKAMYWSNKISWDNDLSLIRLDLQCYNKIKNICIHYNLGNYEYLRSYIPTVKRFFDKKDVQNDYLMAFLSFSRKHLIMPFSDQNAQHFYKILKEIEDYLNLYPEDEFIAKHLNLHRWISSIIK